jgi:hypothetical protein
MDRHWSGKMRGRGGGPHPTCTGWSRTSLGCWVGSTRS